jgi:hypothetical protein
MRQAGTIGLLACAIVAATADMPSAGFAFDVTFR